MLKGKNMNMFIIIGIIILIVIGGFAFLMYTDTGKNMGTKNLPLWLSSWMYGGSNFVILDKEEHQNIYINRQEILSHCP